MVDSAPQSRLSRLKVVTAEKPTIASLSADLRRHDAPALRAMFALPASAHLLKSTLSLCPKCLEHAPAAVFSIDGRVKMARLCTAHGAAQATIENDERYYFLSNKDRCGRIFDESRVFSIPELSDIPGMESCCDDGSTCGEATGQMANKTCTVLVEVTNACNLQCAVCYSDARGDRMVPLEILKKHIDALARKKGGLDSVQLTGGEALLHPQFHELLAYLTEHPLVKKIYLPTNGLELSDMAAARKLVVAKSKLMVLLQFDGVRDATDRALRQATPAKVRRRVIAHLEELGIFMQLTMTLSHGVNDDEVGAVVGVGLEHSHIKVIALQPATYSGRYELAPHADERLTLSDLVKAVSRQASARVREEDFVPIPCSHPNCGWITLFLRRFGAVHNVVRYVDLPKIVDAVAYKTQLSTGELREAVASRDGFSLKRAIGALGKRLVRSHDMFTVAIKPFMDRYTYDHDRVTNCCHHLMDTHGVPTSFCEYNARLRANDSWERFPLI